MPIIRTFLNNGFFVLLFIVVAIIYIAYSDTIKQDHGIVSIAETNTSITVSEQDEVNNTDEHKVVDAIGTLKPVIDSIPKAESQPEVVHDTKEGASGKIVTIDKNDAVLEKVEEKSAQLASEPPAVVTEKVLAVTTEKTPNTTDISLINEKIDVEKTLSKFQSFPEAIRAARNAATKKDYQTAEEIYFSLVAKMPSSMILGEFGNVLAAADKKDLAELSWLEAGRMMIKQNRIVDARNFADRLKKFSEKASSRLLQDIDDLAKVKKAHQLKRQEQFNKRIAKRNAQQKAQQDKRYAAQQAYIKQQKERVDAYQKEMNLYYKKLRAYHEAMQKRTFQN